MPKDDDSKESALTPKSSKTGGEAATNPDAASPELVLPAVNPPQTSAPVQFNQQVNLSFQQIPPTAWDRLSPAQIVQLSTRIIDSVDANDQRQFDYAMEEVKRSASGKKVAICCGSVIAIAGFAATTWLFIHGYQVGGLAIALPLATIIAVIVGNRFLD